MKKLLFLVLILGLVVGCSSESESKAPKETTTTVKKIVKEDDDKLLLSVLPALSEVEAGFTETKREAETAYDETQIERCPGVNRASYDIRYISAVKLDLKKPAADSFSSPEFLSYMVYSFEDESTAKRYLKKFGETVEACKDVPTDLGNGQTYKSTLGSPGKISQADSVLGEVSTYFADGEQFASMASVNAQKGRFVVFVEEEDIVEAGKKANSVLAKL